MNRTEQGYDLELLSTCNATLSLALWATLSMARSTQGR